MCVNLGLLGLKKEHNFQLLAPQHALLLKQSIVPDAKNCKNIKLEIYFDRIERIFKKGIDRKQ